MNQRAMPSKNRSHNVAEVWVAALAALALRRDAAPLRRVPAADRRVEVDLGCACPKFPTRQGGRSIFNLPTYLLSFFFPRMSRLFKPTYLLSFLSQNVSNSLEMSCKKAQISGNDLRFTAIPAKSLRCSTQLPKSQMLMKSRRMFANV